MIAVLRWVQRRIMRKFPPAEALPRVAALERIIEILDRPAP